jgi:tetratricopeptide (TPR) repeat protein
LDLKAWRARVLTWAGRFAESEHAYREILAVEKPGHSDPDHWAGLATACWRLGKIEEALHAIEIAVQLDSHRADLHVAYSHILRAAGQPIEAQAELDKAHSLDPATAISPQPLKAARRYGNEFRVGTETDFLSYTVPNYGQFASLNTSWTPLWSMNLGGAVYERSGVFADKFVGSLTFRAPSFAALTAGGSVANDHAVIPKNEAFFDLDRGRKLSETSILRGLEFDYGQHWYWYQAARILALNGAAILYLPRDWSFALAATGARSAFSGTGAEWRPSGSSKLSFPLATGRAAQLSGNIFFAAGSENFALSDQIGRFASQTYGGGLRFRFAERQDITCAASYQRRTQNRTDTYLGFGYGIHF